MSWSTARGLAAAAVLAVVASACGGDDDDDGGATAPSGDAPEVETGPGVTDDTIRLGLLTDLTDVFAPAGEAHVAAAEEFWAEVNDAGGICGRTVELEVRDHGYDPQQAVAAYQDVQPDVLALGQLLGSPVQAAVLPLAEADEVAVGLVGWSSFLTGSPVAVTTGATYDIQLIAGIQYLVDEGLLEEGDAIGHVYFTGDYGENGLRGSTFAAEELGLEVIEAAIDPGTTDLSTEVQSFQDADARAIVISAAPPQLTSVVNAQLGLDYVVPILGQIPDFQPTLLDEGAVADHLRENYYQSTPIAPFGYDSPEAQNVVDRFGEGADVPPQIDLNFAYAQSFMFAEGLRAACDNGDLTRAGFLDALHSLDGVETGLSTPLSYTLEGPAGTEVYIVRPADVPGGLEVAAESVTSPLVEQYELP